MAVDSLRGPFGAGVYPRVWRRPNSALITFDHVRPLERSRFGVQHDCLRGVRVRWSPGKIGTAAVDRGRTRPDPARLLGRSCGLTSVVQRTRFAPEHSTSGILAFPWQPRRRRPERSLFARARTVADRRTESYYDKSNTISRRLGRRV